MTVIFLLNINRAIRVWFNYSIMYGEKNFYSKKTSVSIFFDGTGYLAIKKDH